MRSIELSGAAFELPESWSEVAQKQLIKLIELLFLKPENGETYHELLRVVLGFSEKKWAKMMNNYFGDKNTEEQKEASSLVLAELLRMISWMWLNPLTTQPMPSFTHNGVEYLLPSEQFMTMTWGELKDAYIHTEIFTKQIVKGDKHLNLLIATICRPKSKLKKGIDWNGDERESYNEYIVASRESDFEMLDYSVKLSVLMYFVGTLKMLLNSYDIYYSNPDSLIPHVDEYPGQGFEDNTLLLAEKQVFGTYKETIATNAHQVLLALERNRKIVEAEAEARKQSTT